MNKLLLTILLAFTFSCAKKDQAFNSRLYVEYADGLSLNFQSKIINAIQKINLDAGGELIAFNKQNGNERPLIFANIKSNEVFAHTQSLDYRCLISIDESNPIINNNSAGQVDLRVVILHEIGHCYNLTHSTDIRSIMYPSFAGTEYLSSGQIGTLLTSLTSFAKSLLTQDR